jgi:hypothetical protein
VDTREDLLQAADVLMENGTHIEYGPSIHGIGEQNFLYFRDPSSMRVEVNTGGYRNHVPDWEPNTWTPSLGSNNFYRNSQMPMSMTESFPPDAKASATEEGVLPGTEQDLIKDELVNPYGQHGLGWPGSERRGGRPGRARRSGVRVQAPAAHHMRTAPPSGGGAVRQRGRSLRHVVPRDQRSVRERLPPVPGHPAACPADAGAQRRRAADVGVACRDELQAPGARGLRRRDAVVDLENGMVHVEHRHGHRLADARRLAPAEQPAFQWSVDADVLGHDTLPHSRPTAAGAS